ncbi:peptidylprolyl isomerase [Neisseria sp. Ec49-e6-T10]|uniref:peptidylprolyl isomerase n=1 Tax=Neisseria sp. Ec49-e6-T10 TaxID=3140744 RepID=UPI003EBFF856
MGKKTVCVALLAALAAISLAVPMKADDIRVKVVMDEYLKQTKNAVSPEDKAQTEKLIASNLYKNDILKSEALKKGLDKDPEVQAAYANMEANFYAQALAADYAKKLKITDAALENTYRLLTQEYKINQIEFKTRQEANKALDLLKKGKVFEELAKEVSAERYIAVDQLPWLPIGQIQSNEMVETIIHGTKGTIFDEPIMIPNGFALVKLEGIRPSTSAEKPDFTAIKTELEQTTIAMETGLYLKKILKQAGYKPE